MALRALEHLCGRVAAVRLVAARAVAVTSRVVGRFVGVTALAAVSGHARRVCIVTARARGVPLPHLTGLLRMAARAGHGAEVGTVGQGAVAAGAGLVLALLGERPKLRRMTLLAQRRGRTRELERMRLVAVGALDLGGVGHVALTSDACMAGRAAVAGRESLPGRRMRRVTPHARRAAPMLGRAMLELHRTMAVGAQVLPLHRLASRVGTVAVRAGSALVTVQEREALVAALASHRLLLLEGMGLVAPDARVLAKLSGRGDGVLAGGPMALDALLARKRCRSVHFMAVPALGGHVGAGMRMLDLLLMALRTW